MTARESVFPSLPPSSDFLNHLEDCVSATEGCTSTLQRGLSRLEVGTKDLPRLTKIMRNKHVRPDSLFLLRLPSSFPTHLILLSSRDGRALSSEGEGKGREEMEYKGEPHAHAQHYLLLPLPVIQTHKSSLATALAPQVDTLISKAEGGIGAANGRIQRLEERLSIIQSARLPVEEPSRVIHPTTFAPAGTENVAPGERFLDELQMKELSMAQRRKVMMLKGKRERLEKEQAKLLRI